jgi:hypothetical protein
LDGTGWRGSFNTQELGVNLGQPIEVLKAWHASSEDRDWEEPSKLSRDFRNVDISAFTEWLPFLGWR